MLKRFFISFLGSIAGIFVAGILGFFAFFMFIAVIVAKDEKEPVSIKSNSVLKIDFKGLVEDRFESTPIMDRLMGENQEIIAVNELVSAIDRAATDDDIKGIYLECNGASAGLAQLEAIRTALRQFKESGKWVYAYADSYTQGNYYLATEADSIFVNPQGMIDIHGLSSTVMYFKDLLDKVGVKVQVVKVGTYKSAVEPFLLNDMSEANREQLTLLLGNMWNYMTAGIAENRGVDSTEVNTWADSFCFSQPVEDYVTHKIVDCALYKHEVDELIATETSEDKPNYVGFKDYFKLKKNKSKGGVKIAVLYAVGDITESAQTGIASDRLVPEIFKLSEKDDIEGLILRVNSGGGSAYASEQIWEALQQFKEKTGKPFFVSMGDYAASGGYYISCGADKIFAEPLTLTGSIGIFGMIPDAQELLNQKIGINTATVATNTGDFPSFFKTMTPEQRNAMQSYVDRGYDLFTRRCAEGRHIPQDSIKKIAEGRVWDGVTAKKLGLVDELGGLEVAVKAMVAAIKGAESYDYTIVEYPKVKLEWYDELFKLNSEFKQRAIESELGEASRYYRVLTSLQSLSPLQCRMDYIEIR